MNLFALSLRISLGAPGSTIDQIATEVGLHIGDLAVGIRVEIEVANFVRDNDEFVGRILDIVFLDFEKFHQTQASSRLEAATVPGLSSSDDLQLWLITQLLQTIYPGSLCEVSESSHSSGVTRTLASSVSRPWEPSLWDPPKTLEMLAGYAGHPRAEAALRKLERQLDPATLAQARDSDGRFTL